MCEFHTQLFAALSLWLMNTIERNQAFRTKSYFYVMHNNKHYITFAQWETEPEFQLPSPNSTQMNTAAFCNTRSSADAIESSARLVETVQISNKVFCMPGNPGMYVYVYERKE